MKYFMGERNVYPSTIGVILLITDDFGKTVEMHNYIRPGTFFHKEPYIELTDETGGKKIFERLGRWLSRLLKKKAKIETNG